jgi:DNA invertase Pin-like site-specific DNA recombinase
MGSELVKPHHLGRRAVIYVRQSSPHQVLTNQESLRLQCALQQRARELGWREADIDVIDADLGLSGAAATHRQGFKELVARVTLGEVGLILSTEVTRLARNCSDWYPLLDVCGHRQCLIADRDGVYDAGSANGRLLLGLKGTISELELHTLRGRLTAGLLAKAARGELALQLPIGLVRDASGVVTKDPDQEIQGRIALVFATFLEVRTAMAVVRTLQARGLTLPRRDRHGDTSWRPATLMAVVGMLRNPVYAGMFVYGRTRLGPSPTPGAKPVQLPQSSEGWRFVVKDKYPAYIDVATFEKIQAMLDSNRADYMRTKGRGIPRDSAALLHGIVWCGECGHKMAVRYKGGSQYVCNHLRQQHNAPECQCLRAAAIDARVAAAFLEAIAPAEIEAWSRARKAQRQADEAFRRAKAQQVERLRYQAALAERQFNRVDPDNRLVAAELERRWEAALGELRRADMALARRTAVVASSGPDTIDPQLRAKIVSLGQRLPSLWADPEVSRAHRKALLRCLIDKVVLRRSARDQVAVRIVWRGGAVSELEVTMPVNALSALSRYAEMEARVLALARAGVDDVAIARTLTAEGHHSAQHGTAVLPSSVRSIRLGHGLKLVPKQTRWPRVPGWLTVAGIAARLQIPERWLRDHLRAGAIQTAREPSGRYLFPDSESAFEALRQLRARVVKQVDLTPGRLQHQGHHHA